MTPDMLEHNTPTGRWARGIRAGLLLTLLTAAPARGQGLEFTYLGMGETAGDQVNLLLGQVSAHRGGPGFMPVFSAQGYVVAIEGDPDATWSVTPAAGLRYHAARAAAQATVGYSLRPGQGDEDTHLPYFGGSEAGVGTWLQGDYWDRGDFGLQGILAYNWGADYLWARARGTLRLMDVPFGELHAGGEAVWQGERRRRERTLGGIRRPDFNSKQVGPVLQLMSEYARGVIGIGRKMVDPEFAEFFGSSETTWYLKGELILTPP